MNWSGVKVSEVQNGKKSMLKIIDMTFFFWGICGLIEDYEVSLPKGKRERERERESYEVYLKMTHSIGNCIMSISQLTQSLSITILPENEGIFQRSFPVKPFFYLKMTIILNITIRNFKYLSF